jgi:serine/threonine protein kinase
MNECTAEITTARGVNDRMSDARRSRRASASSDLEGGDLLDDFEIVSVLARGGMGSIFKARECSTGRLVVLKVPHLHFECDVVFYERFLREEQIGTRLDHPSIVRVIPFPERSRKYLVTEYVEGESLWRTMVSRGRLPVERVLDIARQVCEALAYMHRQGVVHRDLKPENLVIDDGGGVHIIDFGIALDISARRVTWGRLSARLGTPGYMAPEQMRGKRGDARTDLYALGLIMYEMLSGRSAFAADPRAGWRAKSNDGPRPLGDVTHDLDPRVTSIVMRAIERDARRRYQSADEMLAEVRDPSQAAATPSECLATHAIPRAIRSRVAASVGTLCVVLLGLLWFVVCAR